MNTENPFAGAGGPTMLALIEAGHEKVESSNLCLIQGISLETSRSVADWLCLATKARAHLQFMEIGNLVDIVQTPEALAAKIKTANV